MVNLQKIKQEICEIGDRIYKKGFAAANDGNISCRVSENQVVCTPTLVCKGFLKPDDLCVVDMEGNQVAGQRKRTSEIKLHLAIMKERPEVKSVVHWSSPRRSSPSSRRRTSSSWPTTARSALARPSRRPTGGRKSSTRTAAC
jgi:L-fuculose-phosphate aldolase